MSFLRVIALAVPLASGMAVAPLVAESAPASRQASATPSVEGFVAERVPRLAPGVPLNFSVFGSERSAVSVYVEGVPGLVDLREMQPGVYEGTHVIAAGDAPRADSRVVATLLRGGQVARATLDEPLVLMSAPLPWSQHTGGAPMSARPVPIENVPLAPEDRPATVVVNAAPRIEATPASTVVRRCESCAVVESIRVVEAPAPDDLPGKVTRALDDHRRRVLGVLDAIGLPFAGRESQRLAERAMEFEVTLRLADGRVVARRYGSQPTFQVGDTVTLPSASARVATDS
ncbi:MAG: hypothetical protein ABI281_08875 [Caldimonas sp.]